MAAKLTTLSNPLQREICSYLPARHLMRLASTCKAAQRLVAEDEVVWRARAVALRIILVNGDGADPALRQIQNAMAFDRRLQDGYVMGVMSGPAVFARVVNICIIFSVATSLFGHKADQQIWNSKVERMIEPLENERASLNNEYSRIQMANAQREQAINERNALWIARDKAVAECSRLESERAEGLSDLFQRLQVELDNFPCTTNRSAHTDEAIRLGRIYLDALRAPRTCEYPALLPPWSPPEFLPSPNLVGPIRNIERRLTELKELRDLYDKGSNWPCYVCVIGHLKAVNIMDAVPHAERRGWNYYIAAAGAMTMGWGILFLWHDLPVQGSSLTASGSVLLIRGLTSHRFVSRVCGEVQGRWNIVCIRTTTCAKRLLHSPPCERVSSKLSAVRHFVTTKLGEAAGAVAAAACRVFQKLPLPDCG